MEWDVETMPELEIEVQEEVLRDEDQCT